MHLPLPVGGKRQAFYQIEPGADNGAPDGFTRQDNIETIKVKIAGRQSDKRLRTMPPGEKPGEKPP